MPDNLSSSVPMEVVMVSSVNDIPMDMRRPVLGAIHALEAGKVMQVDYDGYERLIEVHAVGVTLTGAPCMRVFQIEGGSISGAVTPGWRLMLFDKIANPMLTDVPSEAPRPGYRQGDKGMLYIFKEIEILNGGH